MSLPQRIPYGFSACLILALLLFFFAEAYAQSDSREERGNRTSVELKPSDASISHGQTPKLELRTFTVEMLNDGVDVSMGIGLENDGVVRAQLRDGAVMTLTCKLALERVRTLLSNEVLSEESRLYQLRHDLLSREFILSSPGQPIVRQKQFDALLASAFQHLDFLLPLQAPLVSGETYRPTQDYSGARRSSAVAGKSTFFLVMGSHSPLILFSGLYFLRLEGMHGRTGESSPDWRSR